MNPTGVHHRAIRAGRRLVAALAVAACVPAGAAAQAGPAIPLSFHDFRPGMTIGEVTAAARARGGSFACETSSRDTRVQECRGRAAGSGLGGPVALWGSAINGVLGVLTVSGQVAPDQLDDWRNHLKSKHGEVDATVQGTQWMLQWVRRGTMVRLTWRVGGGERRASVSFVHGPTLDRWGSSKRQA